MAPEALLPKRKPKENQYLFDLGVRGRKTGLTVADSGIRDENGLEPLDHLFSSPEKSMKKRTNGYGMNADSTISSEEDMDVDESTVPEANAVITERISRGNVRLPPRSKSPIKTFLQSPARRNPSLGPVSSPVRGSVEAPRIAMVSTSVRRKLDFSGDNFDVNVLESSAASSSPQKRGNLTLKPSAKLTNGTHLAHQKRPYQENFDEENEKDEEEDEEDETPQMNENTDYEIADDSIQIVDSGDYSDIDVDPRESKEQEEAPGAKSAPKLSETKKAKAKSVEPGTKKRGRGRPKSSIPPQIEEDVDQPPPKRTRRSLEAANNAPQPVQKPKPGRLARNPKSVPVPKESKPKPAVKKSKLAPIAEADSPEAQRGPPLPRNNRGLLILRRETPMDGAGFKQTRSGRNSIKPLAFWKNERAEYSEDEIEDAHGKFLTSRIKGVVRVEEVEERKKKSYYKPSKGKKRDDEEAEPWEKNPGKIISGCRVWDAEDPTGIHQPEEEAELALSSAAIITREVPDATFKFRKTLTMPFFGSGMVDLPPKGEKKVKNSRRMQMVFFVHFGKVAVTVNDTLFGITTGGMWQVPRGNSYSITNESDKPARIFFAQGCDLTEMSFETQ